MENNEIFLPYWSQIKMVNVVLNFTDTWNMNILNKLNKETAQVLKYYKKIIVISIYAMNEWNNKKTGTK